MSLLNGVFPLELKIARMIPLFKSGEPYKFSYYRPIASVCVYYQYLNGTGNILIHYEYI